MGKTNKQVNQDPKYNSVSNTDLQNQTNNTINTSIGPAPLVSKNKRLNIIHGPDNRSRVSTTHYPNTLVCLLKIKDHLGKKYTGTGFIISDRCIITAGHCVFFKGNWVSSIEIIPGADGTLKPFGKFISKTFRTVGGWMNHDDPNFDYGAIILEEGQNFNFQDYIKYGLISQRNDVHLLGYPSDKVGTQWLSNGNIVNETNLKLFYDADTVGGNSGSPVFINNQVIGVHSFGGNPNYCIKFNPVILSVFDKWTLL